MANISSWITEASDGLPGCPKATIESAIRSIARDFCEKTLLWVKQLTPINVVLGTVEYTLTPLANSAIILVERAELSGTRLGENSMDLLDREQDSWRTETSELATEYMVDPDKVLRLRETPTKDIANGLVVWAALKPAVAQDIVPDFLYNDYYEDILNGVRGKLFRIPSKPWTDIAMGEYFDDLYKSRRSLGQRRKTTGAVKMSIRTQPHPFSTY
jgi:hypothetical protein